MSASASISTVPPLSVVILAAGKGTRMKSDLPKVLHPLGSLTLVERVVQTALALNPARCWVIVGYAQDQIRAALANYEVEFIEQTEQRGTGHALQQVIPYLQKAEDDLLVLYGDLPLLQVDTLRSLVQTRRDLGVSATLLTTQVHDPTGYGRVFCNDQQQVLEIVEHRDCTAQQRLNTRINGGIYCFRWPDLVEVLPQISPNNQQGEYYLTDTVALLPRVVAMDVADPQEILGVNDRVQLSQAQGILQNRIKIHWMQQGVTLIDPSSITIDESVDLEPDVVIEPQSHLRGKTVIRAGTRVGPGSLVIDSTIGSHCQILYSTVNQAQLGDQVTIGPYAHIRPQSQIADHCRIGNFVEVKNATIGSHTNAAHLSYIGDADLGEQVNVGAGTIIANYDGYAKHPTQIGDRSKTGANSVLIAPLTVGQDVTIAGGSTITDDLPDDCLAIARARQVIKPGWQLSRLRADTFAPKPKPQPSGVGLKIHVLRLNPGEDLKAELSQFTHDQELQAACILTTVGSLSRAALRWAAQESTQILEERFEIVSLVGSLCPDGVHLHMALSDQRGKTLGGHVQEGCQIYTTAEIVIGECTGYRFSRASDPTTGYQELQFELR